LIWVALGGRASLMAAFLGAVVVRSLEDLLSETFDAYWLLVLGLLFVLSVVTFPRGVIGEALYRLGGRPPRGE
jgi:branched-chain amino acid transport system permease protein/urea transport system permease protein